MNESPNVRSPWLPLRIIGVCRVTLGYFSTGSPLPKKMIVLSPICKELEEFAPLPYYFLQMEAEKKKQKLDPDQAMSTNEKGVPGE